MLPITAILVRSTAESTAHAALPGAPVVAHVASPVAAPRRAAASGLRSVADRLAPEPAEHRWQGA
jgi:hypothetical protein